MTTDATNPVAEDTSAPGVAAEATSPSDDHETEAFDRVEAPDDDADPDAPAADGEGDAEQDKQTAPAEDEFVEVELDDGTKVKVPKAAAGGYLRHADYTRKTQELAEHRRALETERADAEKQRAESLAALPEEHKKLAILSHSIETVNRQLDAPLDERGLTLRAIDWIAFRNAANGNDAMAELYRDYRARYDAARDTLADLNEEVGKAKTDLTTKEEARLSEQRKKADEAAAKAWEETGKTLAAEIPGWSPEVGKALAKLAVDEFKVSADELNEMHDPRIWRLLHTVKAERSRAEKAEATLKQHTTATNHQKAQEAQPAVTAKGTAQPARVRDDLGTSEWMRRRNAQVAKKRA